MEFLVRCLGRAQRCSVLLPVPPLQEVLQLYPIATARAMPIFGSNRGVLVVTRLTVRSGLHAEVASQRLRTNFRARQLADQPAILDQDSVVSEVQHGVDLLLDQNYCNAVFSELASHIP